MTCHTPKWVRQFTIIWTNFQFEHCPVRMSPLSPENLVRTRVPKFWLSYLILSHLITFLNTVVMHGTMEPSSRLPALKTKIKFLMTYLWMQGPLVFYFISARISQLFSSWILAFVWKSSKHMFPAGQFEFEASRFVFCFD